ncbi:hypothetical protein ACQPTN_21295 [Bradyrhizobium sp. 13971]
MSRGLLGLAHGVRAPPLIALRPGFCASKYAGSDIWAATGVNVIPTSSATAATALNPAI